MILMGQIEINGMTLTATVDISADKKYSRARAYQMDNGKWRGYKTINGRQKAFGCHNTKEQALNAARLERAPAPRNGDATGVYERKSAGENGLWRVLLTIGGKRVRLGEYATWGHAVLVRDVVARRAGIRPVVTDYEMPLWIVSNPVARSYILDRVPPPAVGDMTEYERRVGELNRARVR